jgi:CheY-like chemotaxis protein
MPGLDGLELATEINKSADLSAVRLVLLTSVNRIGEVQRATHGQFAGYLTKPMVTSALLECIDRAIRMREAAPAQSPAPVAQARRQFSARVLVAEDNAVNQRVARRFLERLGCQVDVVDDGAQAVEAVERHDYDLVLMDMQMPNVDGLEATQRIRARHQPRRVPIVALTADAMVGTLERCLAAGMDDYLSKPLDAKQLEAVLDRFVGSLGEPAVRTA